MWINRVTMPKLPDENLSILWDLSVVNSLVVFNDANSLVWVIDQCKLAMPFLCLFSKCRIKYCCGRWRLIPLPVVLLQLFVASSSTEIPSSKISLTYFVVLSEEAKQLKLDVVGLSCPPPADLIMPNNRWKNIERHIIIS